MSNSNNGQPKRDGVVSKSDIPAVREAAMKRIGDLAAKDGMTSAEAIKELWDVVTVGRNAGISLEKIAVTLCQSGIKASPETIRSVIQRQISTDRQQDKQRHRRGRRALSRTQDVMAKAGANAPAAAVDGAKQEFGRSGGSRSVAPIGGAQGAQPAGPHQPGAHGHQDAASATDEVSPQAVKGTVRTPPFSPPKKTSAAFRDV